MLQKGKKMLATMGQRRRLLLVFLVVFCVLFALGSRSSSLLKVHAANTRAYQVVVCPDGQDTNVQDSNKNPAQVIVDNTPWTGIDGTQETPGYGPIDGYVGPSGVINPGSPLDSNGLPLNQGSDQTDCNGWFFYSLLAWPHVWHWRWQNAVTPANLECNVYAWIPNDYAGDQNAQYTLPASGSSPAQTVSISQLAVLNGKWVQLGNAIVVSGDNGGVDVTVDLHTGSTYKWYLGADAIDFKCSYPV